VLIVRINYDILEGNGSLPCVQGGLLYKAPLTTTVFKDFSSCYQHFSNYSPQNEPFVYVDSCGVRYLTSVVEDMGFSKEGIFALSVAEDGFVEMLALHDAS
jgi:hypothetical protein